MPDVIQTGKIGDDGQIIHPALVNRKGDGSGTWSVVDDGVDIFIAYLKQERGGIILVPADKAGKAALKAIKGT